MLSYDEQVLHLEKKGITYKGCSKDEVKEYLRLNNNFFRLLAYRKNFQKDRDSKKYLQLDFAYLKDLAIIDMRLRKIILNMSLDIEHYSKLQLIDLVTQSAHEDGYKVVQDYYKSLNSQDFHRLSNEIEKNKKSIYVSGLHGKYYSGFPIWAFLEVIAFGQFINFYEFCAGRLENPHMKDTCYLLQAVKKARNATAHNNCLINDLHTEVTNPHKVSDCISQILSEIGIKCDQPRQKWCNKRIEQIIACLYIHQQIVTSDGIHRDISTQLQQLSSRLFWKFNYKFNPVIQTTFQMIKRIIDAWYPMK